MDHDNSKDHVYDHEEEDVELQEVASLNEKEDLSVGVQGVRFVYNQLLCVLFLCNNDKQYLDNLYSYDLLRYTCSILVNFSLDNERPRDQHFRT